MRSSSRIRPRVGIALTLVLLVIVGRAAYGWWMIEVTGSSYIAGDADLNRRVEASSFWQDPSLSPRASFLPGSIALLSAVDLLVHDLLVSPPILGTLAVILLLVGLAGVTRQLFPDVPSATPVAVLLVAFAPGLTQLSLTSLPEPLAAALILNALWFFLWWRSNLRNLPVLLFSAFMLAASVTSFDAWLVLLPFWVYGSWRFLRSRERPLLTWAALGFAPLAIIVWTVRAQGSGQGSVSFWLDQLGLGSNRAPEGAFATGFAQLAIGSPVLVLILPMTLVGLHMARSFRVPIGRLLGIGLLLMLVSIFGRASSEKAFARLSVMLLVATPLVAGGTIAAIFRSLERPRLAMTFVWLVTLAQAGFTAPLGTPPKAEEKPIMMIGAVLDGLFERGLLQRGTDLVVIQNRAHNEELNPAQRIAISDSRMARLFSQSSIRTDSILPSGKELGTQQKGKKGKSDKVDPRKARSLFLRKGYKILVAIGSNTRKTLHTYGLRFAGGIGEYRFFIPQTELELSRAIEAFVLENEGVKPWATTPAEAPTGAPTEAPTRAPTRAPENTESEPNPASESGSGSGPES
jgi:hypothetical protein